jgi:pSer/pThr/pTyr-binding forkhead associated (FHA) protein
VKAQVVYRSRRAALQTFRLSAEESVLGRDPGLAVSIPREGISRRHARIRRDSRGFVLEDMKSTNGTFLNGRAAVRERLRHLDVIGLGKDVELVFLIRETPTAPVRKMVIGEATLTLEGAAEAASWPVPPGEVTLGRASACNVILESSAISKVHARVVRSADQLSVEDLGSSNGTFVNGHRVMTAPLENGDLVSLAGVANLRVALTRQEVTVLSGEPKPVEPPQGPPTARRRFSAEWRTRYEWDSGEREMLKALQAELEERDAARQALADKGTAAKPVPAVKPPAKPPTPAAAKPAAPAAAKPVAPAARPAAPAEKAAAPPVAKPAAPAEAKPGVPAARPEPPKAEPPRPAPPAAPKPAGLAPAPPPAAPAARPAQPPAVGPPSQPAAKPAAPAAPPAAPAAPKPAAPPAPVARPAGPAAQAAAPAGKIVELRLTGAGFDLVARESGAHELGRAKDASLRVDNQTVSRQHARIIISDDRSVAYVQDRGGANGTFLNGVTVDKLKLVKDGDVIGLGEVKLKVSIRRG